MKTKVNKYTIVRHSAMEHKKDTTFSKGLEVKSVTSKAEEKRVQEAGGVLFDDWNEADDYAQNEMYQPSNLGLIPCAPGTFSKHAIGGLPIYVPVKKKEA